LDNALEYYDQALVLRERAEVEKATSADTEAPETHSDEDTNTTAGSTVADTLNNMAGSCD
jgi:hypothetical protein